MYLKLFIILFISTHIIDLEASIKSDIQAYENRLKDLQKNLLSPIDSSQASASSLALAKQSKKIIEAYSKLHPICGEYFEVLLSHGFKIKMMSPAAIEFNYIKENSLPFSKPHCRVPKALYVRAMSVSAMLRMGRTDHKKMLRELEEASKHIVSLKKEIL